MKQKIKQIYEALTLAFQMISKPKSDLSFSQWLQVRHKEQKNLERKRQLNDWRDSYE